MNKENIDLAKQHIELAEDLIQEEGKKNKSESLEKEFVEAEFALERAESEISDLEEVKE